MTHREGLDGPDQSTLLRDVLGVSSSGLNMTIYTHSVNTSTLCYVTCAGAHSESGSIGVCRYWNKDLHIVGRRPTLELTLGLHTHTHIQVMLTVVRV